MARNTRRARTPEGDRPSRLRLWLRRRRALLRPAGLGLLGLAALVLVGAAIVAVDPAGRAAALAARLANLGPGSGMTIQEVRLEGARNVPLDLVRAALGVSRGDPTLAFSPQAARERLESIAWVERATVERHLPGTVLVRIEERRPFAIWQREGRFSVIDREGRTVATENLDAFGDLPLVVGAGADRVAAALLDLLREAPAVRERTRAAVRVAERRWNLRLHNGADVLLPEGHEAAAIARLAELQARQGLLDRPLAVVDLRLPDRLVLRTAAGAPPAPAPGAAAAPGGAPAAPAPRAGGRG